MNESPEIRRSIRPLNRLLGLLAAATVVLASVVLVVIGLMIGARSGLAEHDDALRAFQASGPQHVQAARHRLADLAAGRSVGGSTAELDRVGGGDLRRALSDLAANAISDKSRPAITAHLQAVGDLSRTTAQARGLRDALDAAVDDYATHHGRTMEALARLAERVSIASGQRRLSTHAANARSNGVAGAPADTRTLSVLEQEVSDLRLFVEQLDHATAKSQVADIRDNRIAQCLARMGICLERIARRDRETASELQGLRRRVDTALLGSGYRLIPHLQTVALGEGGLLGKKARVIELTGQLDATIDRGIAGCEELAAQGNRVGATLEAALLSRHEHAESISVRTVEIGALLIALSIATAVVISLRLRRDMIRDVQLRFDERQALRRSEQRLDQLARHNRTFAWDIDLDGRFTFVADGVDDILGYDAAELVADKALADLLTPRARQRFAEKFSECHKANHDLAPVELEVRHADRTRRWVSLTGIVLHDATGRPNGMRGSATDITERKAAEERLTILSRAVEQMAATVVITNPKGTIQYVNPAFTATTGYTCDEAVGQNPRILKSGKTPAKVFEDMWATLSRGQTWRGQLQNRCKDGRIIWEDATITPVQDESGNTKHYVAVKDDVTARVEATEALAEARDKAEAANRTKSAFLANMSHEIRSPMTAILGYADLLRDPKLSTSDRANHLETIRRNGKHLLTVINDILDFSKIEAGKMDVEQVEVELPQIIADVSSLLRVRAQDKGLSLSVEAAGAAPATIRTDPTRLRQILMNLIGNAIKFTENGGVRLIVRHDAEAQQLVFEVVDTGIGMTQDQADRLFQPFVQADLTTTRQFGGTGLGLAISKQLAEQLGGGITVRSTHGQGSTFCVTINPGPVAPSAMVERIDEAVDYAIKNVGRRGKPQETPTELTGRVLLAEDGADNQRLISFHLQRLGLDVTIAENGRVAVNLIEQARDNDQPFDLLLLDMQMPVMDGYQAATHLRANGFNLPIIALTAHAMKGDRERCLDAGCSDYATKPIDPQALAHALAQHLRLTRPA